jgi:hypothetical protein
MRKIGSLLNELVVELKRRNCPDPILSREGRELMLVGKKPTLVRGGR